MTFDTDFVPIFITLHPADIVRLKFTLESYEGLGVVRSLSAERGEVVILALRDTEAELRELLAALQSEISFREVPPPESVDGDWLLKGMYS